MVVRGVVVVLCQGEVRLMEKKRKVDGDDVVWEGKRENLALALAQVRPQSLHAQRRDVPLSHGRGRAFRDHWALHKPGRLFEPEAMTFPDCPQQSLGGVVFNGKDPLFRFCNMPLILLYPLSFLDSTTPRHFCPTSLLTPSQQQSKPQHQDDK